MVCNDSIIYSLIVLEKRNLYYFWVIILCILTFILSVTGTFLVRSGILNSVHTFASDPSRGVYILLFLTLLIFISVLILFKKFKPINYKLNPYSKDVFILINNWFMIFYLITVLLGTIYPIFTEVLTNHKVSVGPPFYNSVIIPIVIIFLFLMAIGPKVKWIKDRLVNYSQLIQILVLAILINFFIVFFFKSYSLISNFIIISSIFLIISTILELRKYFMKSSESLSRIVSHLSFGLLIFFIGLNHNFSMEKDFNLKLGDKEIFDNYSLEFKDLKLKEFKNYKAVVGNLRLIILKILYNNHCTLRLEYDKPSTLTYEASIRTGLLKDYYITMSNIDRSDYYNMKFQKTFHDVDFTIYCF